MSSTIHGGLGQSQMLSADRLPNQDASALRAWARAAIHSIETKHTQHTASASDPSWAVGDSLTADILQLTSPTMGCKIK